MNGIVYLSPYLAALTINLAVAIFAFSRRTGSVARSFGRMTFLEALWTLLLLLEVGLPRIETKIILDDVQYLIMFILAVAFVDFTLMLGDFFRSIRYRILAILSLPSVVFIVFLLAPGRQWLYRLDTALLDHVHVTELIYHYGIMAYISIGWAFLLVAGGLVLLAWRIFRPRNHSRFLAGWVASGFLIPAVSLAFYVYFGNSRGQMRDLSPLFFALSNLIIAPVLLRYRLLDALPEVRSDIMRDLEEPVLVTDSTGVIIDGNRAAENLFVRRFGHFPQRERLQLFFPAAAPLIGSTGELEEEFPGENPEVFRIHLSPIYRGGHPNGAVVVFHDITLCRLSERELQNIRSTLEILVDERTVELRREVKTRTMAEEQLALLNDDLVSGRREILLTLGELMERHWEDNARHVQRVAEAAGILASKMGLGEDFCRRIRDAAPLHDVGKVSIPDSILRKPGPLTPSEWEIMRTHAEAGWQILKNSTREPLVTAAVIARSHHERWDGEGYPRKLKGEEIPLEGRIVALADVLDALRCRRFYGDPWSEERIRDYVMTGSGTQFDPEVVKAFSESANALFSIMILYPDSPR